MNKQRQAKQDQFKEPQQRFGGKVLLFSAVLLVVAVAGFFTLSTGGEAEHYAGVKSVNGEVRLDLNSVDDGQAHYFKYTSTKGDIPFFVIKSVDGVMRAAFDACDVCYREKKGYRQEGDMMICNNCNMQFKSDLINVVKGGCNPAPLTRRIEGGQLVINGHDILKGAWYFGS